MFSGISGDMALGAFVDLGVPMDWISKKLRSVLTGFELRSEVVFRSHLRAVDLFVDVHDHTNSRQYKDIRALIEGAGLPDSVKANSLLAFEKIARAEAGIHGRKIDTVHFHEIGGVDSLVDIIGCFLAVDYLGIKRVVASKIPLGSGVVECAHGKIPVPVPATLAILEGLPVTGSDAKTEIVTPTGAAIVATLAEGFGTLPDIKVKRIGYGAGKRDTGSALPNLLRLVLGESTGQAVDPQNPLKREKVQVIKTDVDDMNPEISGFLMGLLLEKGALDVTFSPVFMKKNRPGTSIEVICLEKDLKDLIRVILTQTTAIGVRHHSCERVVLERKIVTRTTSFGPVQMKQVIDPDRRERYLPEYEVCKSIALEQNLPLKDVYAMVLAEANLLDRD